MLREARDSTGVVNRRPILDSSFMKKIELTLACEQYDRTDALREGKIQPEGIAIVYLPLSPQETFWRMLRHLDFDVADVACRLDGGKIEGEDRIIGIRFHLA
jgi:hypothetical protein